MAGKQKKAAVGKGVIRSAAAPSLQFKPAQAIAGDVYFLDYTFEPGGNPAADRAFWRKRAGNEVPNLYRRANSGEFHFFVDGTRKSGPNVFSNRARRWALLSPTPCAFFAYVVQAGGTRVPESGFGGASNEEQSRRSTLSTVRTALALRDPSLARGAAPFRHLRYEKQLYSFEAEEVPTRVAVILSGTPAPWMLPFLEPDPQPAAVSDAVPAAASSGATHAQAPFRGATPAMRVAVSPPSLPVAWFIRRGQHETAVEVTVTNSGGTCFFRELRLTDGSGVIPWMHVPNGKLRGGSQRLQRHRHYTIPSDSTWSVTVYVCGDDEQRFLTARAAGTLSVEVVHVSRGDVPLSLVDP